jgi:multimeric flavodoxin WrbA
MGSILDEIERSDAILLASPMNFHTVTAVMKVFIERLVCFAYWPWGTAAPEIRNLPKEKCAVVVASSTAPSLLARVSSKMVKLLKEASCLLGAGTVDVLFIGLAAREKHLKFERS